MLFVKVYTINYGWVSDTELSFRNVNTNCVARMTCREFLKSYRNADVLSFGEDWVDFEMEEVT